MFRALMPTALALALGAAACGGAPGPATSPAAAAGFTLSGVDGARHSLADYRGSVVLVNFWATWCIPCRAEMPDLEHEYRVHKAEGLVVLGVDVQESRADVTKFINDLGVTYPVLLDSEAVAHDAYHVGGLPQTILIDRVGRVILSRPGAASREQLELEITQALKAPR
jgi:thiol-disulfide isomerase/thioredoxin